MDMLESATFVKVTVDETEPVDSFDIVDLIIAAPVESRAVAAVLERLSSVGSTDCTNPETGFDPTEPDVVIEEVDLTKPVGPLF